MLWEGNTYSLRLCCFVIIASGNAKQMFWFWKLFNSLRKFFSWALLWLLYTASYKTARYLISPAGLLVCLSLCLLVSSLAIVLLRRMQNRGIACLRQIDCPETTSVLRSLTRCCCCCFCAAYFVNWVLAISALHWTRTTVIKFLCDFLQSINCFYC